MGKYVVTSGQNLYDVALDLYGSIEGIVDLMICNRELSLATDLRMGDILAYTDDFVIHSDVRVYNRQHGIVPANGQRTVYPKFFSLPLLWVFRVPASLTCVSFEISGKGCMEIDWDDNSPVQTVELREEVRTFTHLFDNDTPEKRSIRWFCDASFGRLDLSGLKASEIYLFRLAVIEELALQDVSGALDFISLTQGMYQADLRGVRMKDLSPLVSCPDLMRLDLTGAVLLPAAVDEYLIKLSRWYGLRRACEVRLTVCPGGEFREPQREENGAYRISSGMEAIWVILHEPAWNEAGAWKFIIHDEIYTLEA